MYRRLGLMMAAMGAGALALAGVGCSTVASTTPLGAWRDADYHGTISRMLVVSRSEEPSIRRLVEDTIAAKLRAAGVDAVPSLTIMAVDQPVGQQTVRAAIAGKDFSTVLVSRPTHVDVSTGYVPPDSNVTFFSGAAGPTISMNPGYTLNRSEVYIKFSLYNAASGKLVWSMTTKTLNSGVVKDAINSYADALVRGLSTQRLM